MRFRFRDCVLDAHLFELRRAGEPVALQPKVLNLLLFLLENRDRTVSKEEILEAVWPGTATGEGSLTRAMSFARAALGEGHGQAEIIRTVRGRGYRIGVPVALETHADATRSSTEFVCREKELGLARDTLLQAIAGRGQVVLLAGEPGIGKTRLAEELGKVAGERGARVYWGRCHEGGGGPAFWPWSQLLRAYVGDRGTEALHARLGARMVEIAEIVPEIREVLPELPTPEWREPEQARFRLFDSVSGLLRAAAAEQPLLLILDDLQSADEPSLRLLGFLAPELRESRTLVLATYRDVELTPGHPLEATLAELSRSQHPKRTIFLRGLTERCVRRFVERLTVIPPSPDLVDALYRRTEGNPLFLVELLQWLQTRDPPWDRDGAWDTEIPDGVRQTIRHRLEGLSEDCNRVLSAACVVGRDFSLFVLARVCGLREDELLEQLEEAERAHIVASIGDEPGRFRFTHALIAEALHDQLSTSARVRLHGRAAEVLEELYTPKPVARPDLEVEILGSHLSELAHHFCQAAIGHDVDKAVDYATRAGGHAMRVLAFEEAARHYDRALRVLGAGSHTEERRGRLLLDLARAQYRSGHARASAQSLASAIESARSSGQVEALAEAALQLHERALGGNVFLPNPERLRVVEEALVGLAQQNPPLRARLLAARSSELFFAGHPKRSGSLLREAIALARRARDPGTLWDVLYRRRLYLLDPRDDEERDALVDEIFQLALATGDREREFLARQDYRLGRAVELADPRRIDSELAACAALAEELRQPVYHWGVARMQAARALWQGRLEEAEALLEQVREQGRRAGEIANLSYHCGLLALRRMQGRFEELEGALRAERPLPRERGHKWSALALLYAESGRRSEARGEFEKLAADGFAAVGRDSNFTYNLALLTEICVLVAEREHAGDLYDLLLPHAGRYLAIPNLVAAGCASRHLGLLATRLRRWDDAEQHFEQALEVEQRMRARPFEAYTQRDYARMLAARGAPGDGSRAKERRARAGEIARDIGLVGLAPR